MKTYSQFIEDVNKIDTSKILNTFKSNQNVQSLMNNMKDGNLNIDDLKKIAKDKKFTTDIKTQSIDAIQQGSNMLLNKLTTNLKNLGK
mgnify:CR=1 FL=1